MNTDNCRSRRRTHAEGLSPNLEIVTSSCTGSVGRRGGLYRFEEEDYFVIQKLIEDHKTCRMCSPLWWICSGDTQCLRLLQASLCLGWGLVSSGGSSVMSTVTTSLRTSTTPHSFLVFLQTRILPPPSCSARRPSTLLGKSQTVPTNSKRVFCPWLGMVPARLQRSVQRQ